jgi:hypothetical protein
VALKTTLLILTSTKLYTCRITHSNGTVPALQFTTHQILDFAAGHDSKPFIAVDSTSSTVCVAADNKVYVALDETSSTSFSQDRVTWRTLNMANPITSIACNLETVVVGEQSGVIRLYFDLFKSIESNRLPAEALISWHQSPLSSLQFSQNGSPAFSFQN